MPPSMHGTTGVGGPAVATTAGGLGATLDAFHPSSWLHTASLALFVKQEHK